MRNFEIHDNKITQMGKGMKLYTVRRTEVWETEVYAWSKDHAVTLADDEQLYEKGEGGIVQFSIKAKAQGNILETIKEMRL